MTTSRTEFEKEDEAPEVFMQRCAGLYQNGAGHCLALLQENPEHRRQRIFRNHIHSQI